MIGIRQVHSVTRSRPTVEGAGVRLKRAFGLADPWLDPFLLLDDFHSSNPKDYISGFPWHPHRGIETITYMLDGEFKHEDSMGNRGVIGPGDVQWMTAGSGIIHSEMPNQNQGHLWGLQLWANLPSRQKMMNPRYQGILKNDIPEIELENGVRIRIICGHFHGVSGPVRDIVTEPEYMDVSLNAGAQLDLPMPEGRNGFAYLLLGDAYFGSDGNKLIAPEHLVVFSQGDSIRVAAGGAPVRFILVSGKPLGEPVAWRGPIVMNTQEELRIAFQEYEEGRFIK